MVGAGPEMSHFPLDRPIGLLILPGKTINLLQKAIKNFLIQAGKDNSPGTKLKNKQKNDS